MTHTLRYVEIIAMPDNVWRVRESESIPLCRSQMNDANYNPSVIYYGVRMKGHFIFDSVFDIGESNHIFDKDSFYVTDDKDKLNVFVTLSKYKHVVNNTPITYN